jgi:hypothetical protein
MNDAYESDNDPELAEALRLSLAGAETTFGSVSARTTIASTPGPNARVNNLGMIELIQPHLLPSADLILEDGTIIRAGSWRKEGGVIRVLAVLPESHARGLPDAAAVVKWCSKCRLKIDGTWDRNNWAFRCALCEIDLCGSCFNLLPRPCAHEYIGLPPGGGGMGGGGPPAPPPPGRPGGRPGRR